MSSQCQGCTSLCSAAPGSCRYAVSQESRISSIVGQLGFREERNFHACSSKQKHEKALFNNPYAQNLLPEKKRDESQAFPPAVAAEEINDVFRSGACPLAEKLTNEEQGRKLSPGWPGQSESVTSHEDRWRHQARILETMGDHTADVENIIQRWNYRHKKFRGQPAVPEASLHELLPLSGSSGRQSVIMVSRKKVGETAGSCPTLLPPMEENAAGTGTEDVLLERNDVDDNVQGRVADPNPCGSCVHLSLLPCSIRIKALKLHFNCDKSYKKIVKYVFYHIFSVS
jgi:hypothetical protein